MIRIVITAMIFLAITGCGFHLRGAFELPPQMAVTQIRADNMNTELVRGLRRALVTSGVQVVETTGGTGQKDTKVAVLRISRESSSKRVLSVDAQGRGREYELQYEVVVQLRGEGDLSMPEQHVQISRDFLFDPEDVLGKSDEEADLLRDMQQDMVRLILLRLQAFARRGAQPEMSPATP